MQPNLYNFSSAYMLLVLFPIPNILVFLIPTPSLPTPYSLSFVGNITLNVLPFPSSLSTSILP